MENKLTTVHDAIATAPHFEEAKGTEILCTRVTHEERDLITIICNKQGKTVSAFIKQCVRGVLKDYGV